MKPGRLWGIAALLVAGIGCSTSSASGGGSGSSWEAADSDNNGSKLDFPPGGDGWGGVSSGTDSKKGSTPGVDLPPEKEPESDFGAPEGSPNYVYVPATNADQLVRISGATLQVSLVEVSAQPTVVKTIPGQDAAIVLHRGSDEVAVVRSSEKGDEVATLAALPHCNALAIDPKGAHAVVWYDYSHAKPGDPVGSFQALTLLRLNAGKDESLGISTGFRPSAVQFTADGSKALVVTEDGVNIITLATAQDGDIAPLVAITTKPLQKVEREVLTTDDGVWAVIRETGKAALTIVHLPSKKIVDVPLAATPTDLDLVPGGKAALVVLRDAGEVALVTLPAAATEVFHVAAAQMGDLTAGLARVTDDGKTALLYTSVAGIEQVATLDLTTGLVKPVLIKKTVDNALIVPGTRKAILLHRPEKGPGYSDPAEKFVDDAHGYTLFDLDTGYTKLVLTPVKPTEIAFSTAPDKAWLLLPDPANLDHVVQVAALTTFLTVDQPLGSKPEHARYLVKAGVVAVTQQHPSGRITFLNGKSGIAKTVTGYELNGKVN